MVNYNINFLKPSKLFICLYGVQFLIWLFVNPQEANFVGNVSDKQTALIALLRMIFFSLSFLMALKFWEVSNLSIKFVNVNKIKILDRIFFVVFLFFCCGEITYVHSAHINWREVITNFKVTLGETGGRITFTNLMILLVSYYSIRIYQRRIHYKKSYVYLAIVIIAGFFNALFMAQRMHIIYCLAVLSINYIIFTSRKIQWKKILICIFVIYAVVIGMEITRYGKLNARINNIDILSFSNIKTVINYNLCTYLYSDFNNALIMLSCDSDYALWYGASKVFTQHLGGSLPETYNFSKLWTTTFGTVNIFGIWWTCFGYFSMAFILLITCGAAILYNSIKKQNNMFPIMFFDLFYIGIISNTRMNYFFLTKFLCPFLILLLIYFFYKFFVTKSIGRRSLR